MERKVQAMLRTALLLLVFVIGVEPNAVRSQCLTTISAFPYNEGFEAGPAWLSGGTNSDWTWGIPAHPTINGAAQGLRAWCVGGLTGSFYSNGQQSWLESPCYDLSLLTYPWISFSIFWETEHAYDGVGLQYSPNGGTTWINLGNTSDNDCLTTNWFNTPNITALNLAAPRQGWSGTSTTGGCSTGNGSGTWVQASHCLNELPNAAPVKFRFIFGAGTICNTFDGVGIDDIYIGEAPVNDPVINFTCAGNQVQFGNTGTPCPQNSSWNFGEPTSGAANTSNQTTASHTYAGPGTYTVSLTMIGPCNAPVTETVDVTIAQLEVESTPIGCQGNDGTATAVVTGAAGPFAYDWSPGNQSTPTITGLGPGQYTVLVQSPNMCPVQGSATLTAGAAAISATEVHTDVTCNGGANGTATVTATGGSGVYSYTWSPNVGNLSALTGLAAGTYDCTISDDGGCVTNIEVIITEPDPLTVTAQEDATVCGGAAITLTAQAAGGTPDHTYAWSPAGPDVSPVINTVYSVIATDALGCQSASDAVTITVSNALVPDFELDIDQGCEPLCVTFTDFTAGLGSRTWTYGDGASAIDPGTAVHCYTVPGTFDVSLTITDDAGCSGSFTIPMAVEVFAAPNANIGVSSTIALVDDPTFQFNDLSTHATSWLWSFNDPFGTTTTERSPVFTYPLVACYTVELEVANDDGCMDRTSIEVCVEDAFALYAPNAFTPNADGINDGFRVQTTVLEPAFFELTIYDRWGELIHSNAKPFKAWDGDEVPDGVYVWKVRVRDSQGKMQERQGHVTLLR